ncbi:proline and serine-rich protein 1-like [Pimephales promelas]|nr:proline and serine-rich protein 1-like [Pimephales promelas]
MSELELFPSDDDSLVTDETPSQPADPRIVPSPASSNRGRQLPRSSPRTPRRRGLPSPPPARTPPSSSASSHSLTHPNIPPIGKWTVKALRQALINSEVNFSRRAKKVDLYNLYVSLQPTHLSVPDAISPARTSRACRTRIARLPASPPSVPGSAHAPRRRRPSASLGRAPDPVAEEVLSLPGQIFPPAPPTVAPNAPDLCNTNITSAPQTLPLPPDVTSFNFPYFQAPGAHPDPSARMPPLAGQTPTHFLPLPLPHYYPQFFPPPPVAGADSGVRMPPQTTSAPVLPTSNPLHARSSFSLFSATPQPAPPNAVAAEPPPVTNSIRAQILAGADVDLGSLLSMFPMSESNRQVDCGDISVTLKNNTQASSRTLSLAEFCISFNRYTEVICSVFPHRRRELNDYLSIIAELALSYGGSHFYTYHKLFSAKCAVRISQWNQCPYWGALDSDLHNRVFLGCRNISCAICRSVNHATTACPQINPSIPPGPAQIPIKPTSYVPRPAREDLSSGSIFPSRAPNVVSNRQVCNNFNEGKCQRQRCRFLHICNYCGGAHARVVCPVQKAVNKGEKNYLSTPVNISRLAEELFHHPDANFTNYLLSGLSQGFKPGVECQPTKNIICNNLQSSLAEPEVVDELIKKEIESGFMIGPFEAPPFVKFRISPIGVATRKFSGKKRLIIDLSAPHNSPYPSINSLIPLEEFSIKYHDVDQAITMIKIAGRGAWMAKVDITSAFKVMPIHPDSWHLFGVNWRGKFYFSVRLTFGCKSSPKIFDTLSEAICWILSNNYAIPHLLHLLDDFLIISPHDAIPAAHLVRVQKVFAELGIPLAQEKTTGPTTSIEFLGINLDSVNFQASLPKEKIDRIILIAANFTDRSKCSKRELLSLLGHLNYAMRIIPQGRPFITHLLALSSSVHALEDQVNLSCECKKELKLWITFLNQWNGLTFFYDDFISLPLDIKLFTDAAPSDGFGGYYQGRWFASPWPPQLLDTPESSASSALFELYPIVVAASLWGKEWSSKSIQIHCDNEATVQCINKGRSRSLAIMPLLRRLIWISACDQFIINAKHVPGVLNQIADSLSRFYFQRFRMLAPEADPVPTPTTPIIQPRDSGSKNISKQSSSNPASLQTNFQAILFASAQQPQPHKKAPPFVRSDGSPLVGRARPPSEPLVEPSRPNRSESLPIFIIVGRPRSCRRKGSPFVGPREVYSRAPAPFEAPVEPSRPSTAGAPVQLARLTLPTLCALKFPSDAARALPVERLNSFQYPARINLASSSCQFNCWRGLSVRCCEHPSSRRTSREPSMVERSSSFFVSQHPSTTPSPHSGLGLPQYRGENSGFGQNSELGALPRTASQIRIKIIFDFMYV